MMSPMPFTLLYATIHIVYLSPYVIVSFMKVVQSYYLNSFHIVFDVLASLSFLFFLSILYCTKVSFPYHILTREPIFIFVVLYYIEQETCVAYWCYCRRSSYRWYYQVEFFSEIDLFLLSALCQRG